MGPCGILMLHIVGVRHRGFLPWRYIHLCLMKLANCGVTSGTISAFVLADATACALSQLPNDGGFRIRKILSALLGRCNTGFADPLVFFVSNSGSYKYPPFGLYGVLILGSFCVAADMSGTWPLEPEVVSVGCNRLATANSWLGLRWYGHSISWQTNSLSGFLVDFFLTCFGISEVDFRNVGGYNGRAHRVVGFGSGWPRTDNTPCVLNFAGWDSFEEGFTSTVWVPMFSWLGILRDDERRVLMHSFFSLTGEGIFCLP